MSSVTLHEQPLGDRDLEDVLERGRVAAGLVGELLGSGGWNPAAACASTILSLSFRWLALSFGLKSARAIRRASPTSFFAAMSRSATA